jgi:hypothetical protein
MKHPATLMSDHCINALKSRVQSGNVMTKRALAKLQQETTYKPRPVTKVCVMWNGEKTGENIALEDGPNAYRYTLLYLITSEPDYAEKAISILNEWITTCKECTGDNAQLTSSWSQVNFARTVELLKYYYPPAITKHNIYEKYIKWFDRVMAPALNKPITWKFTNGDTYTNWHCSVLEARMQIALLRDNMTLFNESVSQFRVILPEIIEQPYKLCNETLYRDVMHGCMSLGSLVNVAELAWHQGVNLYATNNYLLKDAIEATAAVCMGDYKPEQFPTPLNKVQYWPYGWYIAYNHYNKRLKQNMPKTKALIDKHPVDYSWLFSCSCALTHQP